MAEEGFHIGSAWVDVTPDTSGFKEKLKAALDEAVAGAEAKVKVTLDTGDLDAKAEEAKAKLRDLGDQKADAKITADDADLKAKADGAKAKLDDVGKKKAEPKITADDGDLRAKADDAKAKLDEVDRKKADPKLDLDDSEFKRKLEEDKAALDSAGSGGGGGSFLTAGPFGGTLGMGGIAAGAGALLPGLGGMLAGLGGTAGVGALAFSGVQQAMSAFMALQQQKQSGAFGAQQAAMNFGNAIQIQQAQQQIAQAHAQAAQVAVQSANAIAQSQMNLAMTERNAAASDVQAQQQVIQAQQQMQVANFSLASAQYNLSEAWIQAKFSLQQLHDQMNNQATSLAAAQLAVQQAQYQQQLTDQNAMSTSLDRQQAAIAVAQAQEQLTAVQQQGTYVQQQWNLQSKAGVAGSQQVVTAQEAVKQATFGVTNAQMALKDAQVNLTNTQLNNAAQVKSAQMAVAMAQEQSAYQQQQAATATRVAQQNLTNTLKSQQLQYAASGNAAITFARDMGLLSGPQRQIVREFMTFSGVLQQMQRAAAKAILPGVTVFFQGLHAFLPSVMSAISRFGGVLSGILRTLGQTLSSKAFQQGFAALVGQGVTFMRLFGGPVAQMFRDLFDLWVKGGAASAGLARLLGGLASGLGNLFRALQPAVKASGTILSVIGAALSTLGGALGNVISGLLQALAPALQALLPGFQAFLSLLGSSLGTALASLAPDLTLIGTGISNMLIAATPLLPVLAQLIAALAQGMVPVIGAFVRAAGPMITALVAGLKPVLLALIPMIGPLSTLLSQSAVSMVKIFVALLPLIPTLGKFAAAVLPLVTDLLKFAVMISGPVVTAMNSFVSWMISVGTGAGTLQGVIAGAWKLIGGATTFMWKNVIQPAFQGIKTGADWLYNNGILPLWHGIQTVFGWIRGGVNVLWHNVFDPFWQGVEGGARGFVSALGTIWNGLKTVFGGPVHFLVDTVYDHGIAALWNQVVGAVGLGKLKLPTITVPFAAGGVVPGTDRGRDTVLAALRPQEGVLVPEAVAGIGGPAVIHALNRAYGGGGQNAPGHFAQGGVTSKGGGGIGGFLSGIGHSIASGVSGAFHSVVNFLGHAYDVGKMVAAVATGNTTAFANALSGVISTPAAGELAQVMVGMPKTLIVDAAKQLVQQVQAMASTILGAGGVGQPGPHGAIGGGVQQYAGLVLAVLRMLGQPAGDLGTVLSQMTTESGGSANVVNRWDSNWLAGTPSVGLMQVIGPTFGAYAGPFRNKGPFLYGVSVDPEANIYAGLNYAIHRYGSGWTGVLGHGHGYDSGGLLQPGATLAINRTGRPEAILNPVQTQLLQRLVDQMAANGGSARPINVQFVGTQVPTGETMAIFKRELALALSGPG